MINLFYEMISQCKLFDSIFGNYITTSNCPQYEKELHKDVHGRVSHPNS